MGSMITDARLRFAEQLLEAMRQGDEQAAGAALAALADARDSMLFQEIGSITRDLHDSLRQFAEDNRLAQLAAEDVPDARERLRYVTTLTEQAANRTLEAVEQALPLTANLVSRSTRVAERLAALKVKFPDNQPLQDALGPMETYLASVNQEGDKVHASLNEVVMAQEFQDLTGQLLHRVIQLLEHLEDEMVKLIRVVGVPSTQHKESASADATRADGPALPGAGESVMRNQDDVDDLLASLGF
ncbi:MAG: protein phosphatase CheZ [Pseudomonadota bacterium]